jgi:hypothetical protein
MAMPEGPANRPQQDDLGVAADGLSEALEAYRRAQDDLVEARNQLARPIAGAATTTTTIRAIRPAVCQHRRSSSCQGAPWC